MHSQEEKMEKWLARETEFAPEIPQFWGGDWGVSSEVGKLRAVLLRRPGVEIKGVTDPTVWRWREIVDPEKAREEHDSLAAIYRENGAKVYYVDDMHPQRPNAYFLRDSVFMTPEGAIIARHALEVRRGEERWVAQTLARLGVPIVRTVTGKGIFEGACGMWVDRETVILGTGVRANREGVRQVEEVLRPMGVNHFLPFSIPYGHPHVDGVMNLIAPDLAIIFPWQTPHDIWAALRERGFHVLEAPWVEEVKEGMALNFVALEPGKVVMPAGNPRTQEVLEKAGVEVLEQDISELRKGWGGIHCMTVFLRRD
jgi:N-dimethylarginine dimethylaminohydrolase